MQDVRISVIDIDGKKFERLAIRTHVISKEDKILDVIEKYTEGLIRPRDILVISERIIAIMQGRSFLIEEIKPSLFANILWRFVTKNPGGIGLRSPHTMELALREAGVLRVMLAAFLAFVTKPLGLKGLFYVVAGNGLNAIDGPCDYTLPPGNASAKLGPKDPSKVAQLIANQLKIPVVIIDANDLGQRVEGTSRGANKQLVLKAFRDNPLGQRDEQTPMAIVRRVD